MKRENCVLVIAGPSAVGKTVVAKAIVEKDPRYTFLRSGTTRPKRGDAHDDEYLYYTEDEFLSAVERGEFAEHMRYGGNLYGTPKSELQRALDEGKIPLMVLDLVGVESLYRLDGYSACSVYIYTDIETIEGRLSARYFKDGVTPEGEKSYSTRCAQNRRDYSVIDGYSDYIFKFIKNDATIEDCRDRVMETFLGFTAGDEYDIELGKSIAKELSDSVK
jgi:guanylate kinase